MKKIRLFLMMVLAAAVSFTACDPNGKEPSVATPTVAVTIDEASVTSDGFTAAVVTTDAEKAAWYNMININPHSNKHFFDNWTIKILPNPQFFGTTVQTS